jgi:ATP-dependent Clp protease ATP-binding subunit ClpA
MINLEKTEIYEALQTESFFWCLKIIQKASLLFSGIFLILYIFNSINSKDTNQLLGAIIVTFSLSILTMNLNLFFDNYIKKPNRKISLEKIITDKKENLAQTFNLKSTKYLDEAIKESKKNGLNYPNYETLLKSFLDIKNQRIIFIFARLMIDLDGLKKELEAKNSLMQISREEFEAVFEEAGRIAIKRDSENILEGDIIAALAKVEPHLKQIIIESDIEEEDFEKINYWLERVYLKIQKNKQFWTYENLLKLGSLGKDWTAGYTPTLDNYSIDWTDIVKRRGFEDIVGHKDKISQLERILSTKDTGNALIIGEPGVGRKNIIHGLIKKSLVGQSLPNVNNNRFVELDIMLLSSTTASFEQMEKILDQCFREVASAGNVILIINDFHDFLGGKQKAGVVDISGIIGPYLASSTFKTICLTSFKGLHQYIEDKPSLLVQFQKIEVEEMGTEETLKVLENEVFKLETKHQKFIPFTTLKETITLCEKYVSDYPFPQKAINLLDEAVTYSGRETDTNIVLPEHIDKILSEKIKIPVGKIRSKEKEILLNLEDILRKRVIGQDEAIVEISSALRRARTGVQTRKGPMGSFLFLGPTGVGKTETAKALAETYFGSEERMIRIDMSEFQRINDIPRLLGSEKQPGILTSKVLENPFSLVLLDEIEKANPNILNIFLQVLDEGYVNDNLGRKISFTNTIIIATSNAGYQTILKATKENKEIPEIKKDLLSAIFEKGTFRPEFINRFDGTIIFRSLTKDDLMKIAQIQLNKLNDNLKAKKIQLIITEELKNKIVELSYDPVFGAREMKRITQDKIENAIARALLKDEIPQGSKIQIDPITFSITIS